MKVKMKGYVLAVVGAFCIAISGMGVEAAETIGYEDVISPRYSYIIGTSSKLSIADGVATCSGSVTVLTGKSCSVVVTLQKNYQGSWVRVTTWNGSGTTGCSAGGKVNISKGVSYRVKTKYECAGESGIAYSSIKTGV